MEKIYFKEEQRFWDEWWVKAIFVCIVAMVSYDVYKEYRWQGFTSPAVLPGILTLAFVAALFIL